MEIGSQNMVQRWMDRFLYSPAYFWFLGIFTVLSNVFGQEQLAYAFILLTGVYVCLWGRDMLPILPIFACCYISPSLNNNPGLNEESIFSLKSGGLYLAVLLTMLAVSLVYRLVTDPVFGGKRFLRKKRSLLPGMLILSATYAVSGIFSGQWAEYGWRNLLFAFIQLVAIAGLYFLLSGAVRWDIAPKAYLFWTAICMGYVLLVELAGIYIKEDVVHKGMIVRNRIVTGWGHYNSMGVLFAMLIPLALFLTGKGKMAWFAYLSSLLFCFGLVFTCSRGSILVGIPIYIAAYILSLVHSRRARKMIWVHALMLILPVLALARFDDQLPQLFKRLIDRGFTSSVRIETYMEGIGQFLQFPIFGGSFFPLNEDLHKLATAPTFSYLFPPRWHNTVVQLLATGGVVCLVGYGVHRVQTIRLFTRHFSTEKLFVGLSIAALLLTSMVDCHFFNVGPVLLYSAMLAVVEFQLDKERKIC